MQVTDEMVMAHAVEDAKFAGKSFDTLGRADRARYLERSRLCLQAAAALVDVPAEPVAWREIEGYEGLYEVSSDGDVRSIQTGKLLAKNLAGSGYVKADLWKNGKRWQTTVHRLVADAFLEKQGSEINHINGVKTDNRVENLEWCTRSENASHSFYVLSKRVRPVEAYNPGTGEKRHYRSVCEAARDGFKSSQIYRALKNPNRTVKGFHWQEASPPLSREGEDTAEAFARVVAARKAHIDATDTYNTRLALVNSERARGNWSMRVDQEARAMWDAQSAFIRTAQDEADAALAATRSGSAIASSGGQNNG